MSLRLFAILLATVVAMWLVLTNTASNVYLKKAPTFALRFDGSNNFALSKIAGTILLNQKNGAFNFDDASKYAIRAIRIAPRDSDSLAVLAFAADAGKFKTEGLHLAQMAQNYSKRSLLSQIYLIQDGAKHGRIREVLEYYDLALTTHPASQRLLLPMLYTAIEAPEVRRELVKILARDSAWKKDFWLGLSDLRPVPPTALDLLDEARADPAILVPGMTPRFVRALASDRRFDDAARIADWGSARGHVVRGPRKLDDFAVDEPSPPIDWEYRSSGSHNASPAGRDLLLSVRGTRKVVFGRRLLFLSPGERFALAAGLKSDSGNGQVELAINCANGTPIALAVADVARGREATLSSGPFSIPETCPQQWVTIGGKASGMSSTQLTLRNLTILQVNR